MIVLGVDVETSGLDPAVDVVTELGAVLWCTDSGIPLRLGSMLVQAGEGEKPLGEEVVKLTGISDGMRQFHGHPLPVVVRQLVMLMGLAEAVVAHNAPFDRAFIETMAGKCSTVLPRLPWVDTLQDIDWPAGASRKVLGSRGFAYSRFRVNPFAQ